MAEIQVHGGLVTPHAPVVQVAQGPTAYFDPKVFPGLVLWLRSDLGITLNGSTVSAWADQSGQGNNATQGTAAKQPTYAGADAGYAGKPTLAFASANSQVLNLVTVLPAQPFTIYFVGESTSGATQQEPLADNGHHVTAYFTGGFWAINDGTNIASTNSTQGAGLVICGVFDGLASGLGLYINNSKTAAASGAGTGGNPSGSESVGAEVTTSFLNGKIAELAVYNVVHGLSQRRRVFQYLGARYGIAVS